MQQPEILFEDNHLLLLVKPAGLLTQPSDNSSLSLHGWAEQWIAKSKQKTKVFLQPVHRLDKCTSGMVLFAKTSKALTRLNESFREKKVIKKYVAITHGSLPSKEGQLEHLLIKNPFKMEICSKSGDGKKALLRYSVLRKEMQYSYIEVTLVTGFYHQIRVQLSSIDCPIVGDVKYGSPVKNETITLHHTFFSFPHPISKEILIFHCPPPFAFWFSIFPFLPHSLGN